MFTRVPHNQQPTASRKRRKTSHAVDERTLRTGYIPTYSDMSVVAAPVPLQETVDRTCLVLARPCEHENQLDRLETDMEAMRQLITCKICQRYLTEPYNLACGHTYCYICLDTWLVDQSKRTCPECRARVVQEPSPSFVVKGMVTLFSSREDLLPLGDTMEDVAASAREASQKVMGDRGPDGSRPLFKGLFTGTQTFQHAMPYHDEEDGVYRCPYCGHEVADDVCSNPACIHHEVGYDSDDDHDELYGIDHDDSDMDHAAMMQAALDGSDDDSASDDSEESDQDSEDTEDEDDSEMDGFIDDSAVEEDSSDVSSDSDHEASAVGASAFVVHTHTTQRAPRPVVLDSDSGSEVENNSGSDATVRQPRGSARRAARSHRSSHHDTHHTNPADGVLSGYTAHTDKTRRARAHVVSDSSESESNSSDEDGVDIDADDTSVTATTADSALDDDGESSSDVEEEDDDGVAGILAQGSDITDHYDGDSSEASEPW